MDKIEEVLTRRVAKIYPSRETLEKVLRSGKKLRLYQGFDPTGSQLHLGHTVGLRKLMEFARLGHEVIFLFGTGTVLVGDPSERETGRKLITEKEINKNISTWKDQVKPIVDFKKVKIKYNADWLTKLALKDLVKIASKITAVQLFKRESFTRRIKAGDTVWYHETMYPLLQGYDSVAMDVDLEIGGTDQTFNMLVGRELQRKINNKEKFVLTTKMIVGTDGKPMSKTSRNCIWLTDNPRDMFGKIMSISDDVIADYFEFFTNSPMNKVTLIRKKLKSRAVNPLDYKKELALEISKQFHGEQKAKQTQKEFERVFQKRKLPSKMPIKHVARDVWPVVDLLVSTKLCSSKSEAKRLISQGAVDIDNQTITDPQEEIKLKDEAVLKVGKKTFIRIKIDS
jgi:tyrosyl-tRNA synthetase